ncbi:MAG: histidine phosphatase domain-containing protein [Harvfovirus sp.]|uniref:Histidine phosphatase domain-containing protein n=1 Tax=Harvfovirus sp. TaxID=2487768 RepID=A0A3G5A655_9VIRU|nr:MAG: histidine phosphatase domain-containing protein [Harvfovirus sp.]
MLGKLRKVVIVARHGPRFPMLVIPKLPKWSQPSTKLSEVALTKKGEEACLQFGKAIRLKYGKLFPSAKFYSSPAQRTIMSAKFFAKGYLDRDISPEIDPLLRGGSDFAPSEKKYYDSRINSMRLRNSRFNKEIYDILGVSVARFKDYFEVKSTIDCYVSEGIELPRRWTLGHMRKLDALSNDYYHKLYDNKIRDMFSKDLKLKLDSILQSDFLDGELIYFSTHDAILYPLGRSFFQSNARLAIPGTCGHMLIECYDDRNC